jgi:hypothetical protein
LIFDVYVDCRWKVFENRMLRRIVGSKRDEVTGAWRKLHNEELHNLHILPIVIRMIKSRRMRWAVHVARIGEKRNRCRLMVGKPEGKSSLWRQDMGGWIILKLILEK